MARQVLIVEDDEALRVLVSRFLQNEGLTCQALGSTEAAARAIAEEVPVVVIADGHLADGSGVDWLLGLKKSHPAIETVLVTGDVPSDPERLMRAGISHVVAKPFNIGDLVRCVRTMIARRESHGEDRARLQGDLAAVMCSRLAHTLKNRVAAAKILAEVFENSPPHGEDAHIRLVKWDDIAFLLRQLDDLDRMVSEVGWFGREASGLPETLDARLVAEKAVAAVAALARSLGVEVQVEVACGGWIGESSVIARIFERLLRNAVEASAQGQRVFLTVSALDDPVELVVRDVGSGMTDEIKGRAFEPFFSMKANHIGLGLTACWRDVARLGGDMTIEATGQCGTTMRVRLPRKSCG